MTKEPDLPKFSIRLPKIWMGFATIYLLLEAVSLVGQRTDRNRYIDEGMTTFDESSILRRMGASFDHSFLAGLENLAYFYAAPLIFFGLPTLATIVIYSIMKEFDRVRGLLVSYTGLFIIKILLQVVISP